MKKTRLAQILLVMGATFVVCWSAIMFFRGLKRHAWLDWAPQEIQNLAVSIEVFKVGEGYYPKTLLELTTNSYSPDREGVMRILSNPNVVRYDYQTLSNGFVITAVYQAHLLNARQEIVKRYKFGEVLEHHE